MNITDLRKEYKKERAFRIQYHKRVMYYDYLEKNFHLHQKKQNVLDVIFLKGKQMFYRDKVIKKLIVLIDLNESINNVYKNK